MIHRLRLVKATIDASGKTEMQVARPSTTDDNDIGFDC
jgi:hypothetical protein